MSLQTAINRRADRRFDEKRHSKLAKEHFGENLPLNLLRSEAGFYLGAGDEEIGPICRDSQYCASREAAQHALDTGDWAQQEDI